MPNSPLTKFNVLTTQPRDNDNGLVGWWTFDDGTATDWSGNQNNGALVNSPLPVAGIIRNALSFNGSSSYVNLGNGSAFNFERTNSFSISAWINTTSTSTSIIGKMANSSPYTGWNLEVSGAPLGPLSFYLINSYTGNCIRVYTSITVNVGKWVHVAATYTGNSLASGVNMYVNGNIQSLIAQFDSLSSSILNSNIAQIGARVGGEYFNGSIDDVRIYNRALSSAEINAIYNQGLAYQQGYPEGEMEALRLPKTVYALGVSPGSFALTGASVSTPTARKLSGAPGTFLLTGANVGPQAARKLAATLGAFALSGQSAAALAARHLSASFGSFALTGESAVPKVGRALAEATGSFALSGHAATPKAGRDFPASTGIFILSGEPATGSLARFLSVVTGEFTLTGEDAAPKRGIGLAASHGAFALDGLSAIGKTARKIGLATAAFSLTGSSATPTIGRYATAATGTFALGGHSAVPTLGYALTVSSGAFSLEGMSALLRVTSGFPRFRHINLIGAKPETSLVGAKPEAGLIGSKPTITLTGSDS